MTNTFDIESPEEKVHDKPPSPVTVPEPVPDIIFEEQANVEKLQVSNWLTLADAKQNDLLANFLVSQTSKTAVVIVGVPLTLVFAYNIIFLILSGHSGHNLQALVVARVIRCLSCGFIWLHLHAIMGKPSIKMATFYADQFILWSSISGASILIILCLYGACDEDQQAETCNPRHQDHGVPSGTLVANLFMISLLPVIFKGHKSYWLLLSYSITFFGLVASAIIAKATADVTVIFACIFAFGVMIYDHERNMVTMFLLIQNQQSYYNKLLTGERATATAEIEKDELRNLIGSVAHDLKTPLHAIMAELDGLQAEVDGVKHQLMGLSLLQLPAVTTHVGIISGRANEAQVYIDSLRDIYQFMVMAINRAIEFRKTAAGLALLASNETFHLPKAAEWAVKRFASNPSGVDIRIELGWNLSECCPFVISDKHWLTENILTLLSNAVKFTSRGEIVLKISLVSDRGPDLVCSSNPSLIFSAIDDDRDMTVEMTTAAQTVITADWIAAHPMEEVFVRVEVEDSGIGVSADAVHNLFLPFGKSQARAGGAGLGLFSLSKRMEVLNGRCGMLRRDDGKSGCRFWFTFPYVPDADVWQECGGSTTGSESYKVDLTKLKREIVGNWTNSSIKWSDGGIDVDVNGDGDGDGDAGGRGNRDVSATVKKSDDNDNYIGKGAASSVTAKENDVEGTDSGKGAVSKAPAKEEGNGAGKGAVSKAPAKEEGNGAGKGAASSIVRRGSKCRVWPEHSAEESGEGNKLVLVVDDSSLILKTTARMLRKEGFEVETAQNGEEGLLLMQGKAYCFVLSDIQMPVMDGLEMAQRIRHFEKSSPDSQRQRPHRIIGMSANSDAETRDDSLACGMNAFIPKPVRMPDLLRQVHSLSHVA